MAPDIHATGSSLPGTLPVLPLSPVLALNQGASVDNGKRPATINGSGPTTPQSYIAHYPRARSCTLCSIPEFTALCRYHQFPPVMLAFMGSSPPSYISMHVPTYGLVLLWVTTVTLQHDATRVCSKCKQAIMINHLLQHLC